ncbi:MAG: flippase [Thermodesulfobacteriota bacterium]
MSVATRIARNSFMIISAQTFGQAMAFFYFMYIARHLGAEGFGVISFAIALVAIFAIFMDFGLPLLTAREVARDNGLASKHLANLSAMRIFLCSVTFAFIVLTMEWFGYKADTGKAVYLVALSAVIGSFCNMLYSVFQAYERLEYQSAGLLLNGALTLSGVFIATVFDFGVIGFASLFLFASVASLLYGVLALRAVFPEVFSAWRAKLFKFDAAFWKTALKDAYPFGLIAFFCTATLFADSILIERMKGDAAVGLYNAPVRIVSPIFLVASAVVAAVYPAMAKGGNFFRLFEKSFEYLTIIGVPIGIVITLLAERLIEAVFGVAYAGSAGPLKAFAWVLVFVFMSIPFSNLFACLNRQSVLAVICAVSLVFNVLLNIAVIPGYGITGASVVSAATQFMIFAFCYAWSVRAGYYVRVGKFIGLLLKVSASGAVMGVFITGFGALPMPVLVPIAALIYGAALFVVKGIRVEDMEVARNALFAKGRDVNA